MKTVDNVQRIADNVRMQITMTHDTRNDYIVVDVFVQNDHTSPRYSFHVDGRNTNVYVYCASHVHMIDTNDNADTQRAHVRAFIMQNVHVFDVEHIDTIVNTITMIVNMEWSR